MTHMQCDLEHTGTPQAHVRDLMTPAPLAISPATSVDEAYRLMQGQRIGHLPVCEDGHLVGLISERDLRLVLPSPATRRPRGALPAGAAHCGRDHDPISCHDWSRSCGD